MTEQVKSSAKKIYQEPSLRVYGDIRMLTQTVNMMGVAFDAGVLPGNRKTG